MRSPAITSARSRWGVEDPLAAFTGDPGAEIFRACVACHTLSPDEGNRAGPTLAGIFGRRIASLPGYNFSEALRQMDIVWTPETVAKLFELGPAAYTPGTKMPEQRIGSRSGPQGADGFSGEGGEVTLLRPHSSCRTDVCSPLEPGEAAVARDDLIAA